jgi:glycosyltransferase involved in cell wall biosynthesis
MATKRGSMPEQDHPPLVSVLLPVFNGAPLVRVAVESVLGQSYGDFELIVIDDGSTDDSAALIEEFSDPRIRFYRQSNSGLAATLNRAIALSRGKYLARQDQDDISLPSRFEKQVYFLETHPACGMVGSWAEIWEGDRRTSRTHRHPCDNLALQFELLFDNQFVHSSVMSRRDVFERVGKYCTEKSRQPPEDYELWSRVAREFEVANLPELLQVYREVPTSMSRDRANPTLAKVIRISAENLALATGKILPCPEIEALAALSHGKLSGASGIGEMLREVQRAANCLRQTYGGGGRRFDNRVRRRLIFTLRRFLISRWCRALDVLLPRVRQGVRK